MATIDKALPNEVRNTIEIEDPAAAAEEIVNVEESIPSVENTEITPTSDGGVEINFDPGAFSQGESVNHFDNLAELLPENILGQLGSELYQNFLDYKTFTTRLGTNIYTRFRSIRI
jgi:hypothetical protein